MVTKLHLLVERGTWLHHIDRDGAEIAVNCGHAASLLLQVNVVGKESTAAAEAVSIVLAELAVTSINSTEHIAW